MKIEKPYTLLPIFQHCGSYSSIGVCIGLLGFALGLLWFASGLRSFLDTMWVSAMPKARVAGLDQHT